MGHAAVRIARTAAEFLARDRDQTVRHEFVAGEVHAMAGAGEAHVTVAGNIYVALRQHCKAHPAAPSLPT